LLIAAEAREYKGIDRRWRNDSGARWAVQWSRICRRGNQRFLLSANGVGAARAAQAVDAALAIARPDAVVSFGFCGALDPELRVGDVFVGSTVIHAGSFVLPRKNTEFRSGPVASVDHVVETAEAKRALRASGASIVEMESAGVAVRAAALGLPAYCIRAVTDLAGESFTLDLNGALRDDGRFDTMHLLRTALLRPRTGIPELLRLRNRSQIAARALGDFLADCEL
jgi:adenosylhomocysteine nucleosidase